jgi:hypothetical protein
VLESLESVAQALHNKVSKALRAQLQSTVCNRVLDRTCSSRYKVTEGRRLHACTLVAWTRGGAGPKVWGRVCGLKSFKAWDGCTQMGSSVIVKLFAL